MEPLVTGSRRLAPRDLSNLDEGSVRALRCSYDVRAVLLDVDGTILDSKGTCRTTVREEIERVKKCGVKVAIASGRPFFASRALIADLGISAPSLFDNGAVIIDPVLGKPLRAEVIPQSLVLGFTRRAQEAGAYFELYTEQDYYCGSNTNFGEAHRFYLGKCPTNLSSPLEFAQRSSIVKMATIFRAEEESNMRKIIGPDSELSITINPLHAHPGLVIALIASKGAARELVFRPLLEHLNVSPEQTLSIGDGASDVPFIKLAGVGIAMGNAKGSVKEAAKFVTGAVDEDGLVVALRVFVPG